MNWIQLNCRPWGPESRTQLMICVRALSLFAGLPLAVWLSSGWVGLISHWNPARLVHRGVKTALRVLRSVCSTEAIEASIANFAATFVREPIPVPVSQPLLRMRRTRSWQ